MLIGFSELKLSFVQFCALKSFKAFSFNIVRRAHLITIEKLTLKNLVNLKCLKKIHTTKIIDKKVKKLTAKLKQLRRKFTKIRRHSKSNNSNFR